MRKKLRLLYYLLWSLFIKRRRNKYLLFLQLSMGLCVLLGLLGTRCMSPGPKSIERIDFLEFKPDVPIFTRGRYNKIAFLPKGHGISKRIATLMTLAFEKKIIVTELNMKNDINYLGEEHMPLLKKYLCIIGLTDNQYIDGVIGINLRFPPFLRNVKVSAVESSTWRTYYIGKVLEEYGVTLPIKDMYTSLPGYYLEGFLGVLSKLWESLFASFELNLGYDFESYKENTSFTNVKMQAFPRLEGKFEIFYFLTDSYFGLFIMLIYMMSFLVCVKDASNLRWTYMHYLYELMGVSLGTIGTAWYIFMSTTVLPLVILTVIVLKIPTPISYPILPNSSCIVLFIFLFLYCLSIASVTFTIGLVVRNPYVAVCCCGLYYVTSILPLEMTLKKWKVNFSQNHVMAMLFPNTAMGYGAGIIYFLERYNEGLTLSNLSRIPPNIALSMWYIFICFIVQSLFYTFISWYIKHVNIDEYGLKRPWNFRFKTIKSIKKVLKTIENMDNCEKITNKEIIIQVRNLEKKFKKKQILHDINIDIYQYGVTSILGENGCGKSTFLFIIAGILQATSGEIYVNKKNICVGYEKFGVAFGFCPQNSILTTEFTIYEQLLLCCQFRGISKKASKQEIFKYLKLFNLIDDKDNMLEICSDGVKKKVQIILAFITDPDIIMLDHPTAYLDSVSKLTLWNLIKEKKKTSTILMVSYITEEVEVLSDRVLIMKDGTFIAAGSANYIRQLYGIENSIEIQKQNQNVNVHEISKVIRQTIPDIRPRLNLGPMLQYLVPKPENEEALKKIQNDLESHKSKLGIETFSIRDSVLDVAFAKAIGKNAMEETSEIVELDKFRRYKGVDLRLNQIEALFLKQYYYIKNLNIIMTTKFLLPSLLVYVSLINYIKPPAVLPPLHLETIIYTNPIVFLSCDDSTIAPKRYNAVKNYIKKFSATAVHELKNETVLEYYVRTVHEDRPLESVIAFGIDFAKDGDSIFFNTKMFHSSAVALNTYYNAIFYDISKVLISVSNFPVSRPTKEYLLTKREGEHFFEHSCNMISVALSFLAGMILGIYSLEHLSGFYHLQIACEVKPTWYWFAVTVWDYIFYILCVSVISLTVLIFRYYYCDETDFIRCLFIVMLIFGLPFLMNIYNSSNRTGESVEIIYNIIMNIFTGTIVIFLDQLLDKENPIVEKNLVLTIFKFLQKYHILNFFSMWFNLYSIMLRLHHLSTHYVFCKYKIADCQKTFSDSGYKFLHEYYCQKTITAEFSVCNEKSLHPKYFAFSHSGVGILCLLFVIKAVVNLIWRLLYHNLKSSIKLWFHTEYSDPEFEEPEVSTEKDKIRNYRLPLLKRQPLILLNLTKYFGRKRVVNGICLEVHNGEAVGLMGLNGSGTSTTFSMLTHQTGISYGMAYISGYNLLTEYTYTCQKAAITPPLRAFGVELKIGEIVTLIAMMRGYCYRDAIDIMTILARSFHYEKYINFTQAQLCSGILKLISVSLVSIGNCPVLLYDNPAIGLDTPNRNLVWTILSYYKRHGRCIVFISNNLAGLNILSDKVGIIVKGNMMSLGPLNKLNDKYNSGINILIHLKENSTSEEIRQIENYILQNFFGAFKEPNEEERTLSYYVMTSNLKHQEQYEIMENGMKKLAISDYTITKASLVSFLNYCYDIV